MKKIEQILVTLIILIASNIYSQVGINTDSPDPSSILDIVSTGKGMLPPRMTTAQMNSIQSPADGLVLYNTDQQCLFVYRNAMTKWENLCNNPKMEVQLTFTSPQSFPNDWKRIDYTNAPILLGGASASNYDLTNDVVKITRSGRYIVQANTNFTNSSSGNNCRVSMWQIVQVRRAGSVIAGAQSDDRGAPFNPNSTDYYVFTTTGFLNLVAGDEVYVDSFASVTSECSIIGRSGNLQVMEL